MEKWEFQRQDSDGSWRTIHTSSGPMPDQLLNINLNNVEKANPGKRVRALCNGRVVEIR